MISATLPHPTMGATPIFTSPVNGLPTAVNGSALPAAVNGAASSPGLSGVTSNSPCSTLFVANLGQFSSEQELKDLFSRYSMGTVSLNITKCSNLSVANTEWIRVLL